MSAPAGVVDGLLAGRYRLTSRLAAGAFGEVWRARDLLLDRDVAVKTLRPEVAEDEGARERFRAEARSTGRLSHPGIAAVYDAGEDDGRAWLVLELVEGESLQAVLRSSGRLSPERTLDIVTQAAAALQVAHDRGVVHRDVKPGNLLLRPDGTVKVTDFGIASVVGSTRLTRTGELVGTAAYLSPEQAAGSPATALSDLYGLGVVAYECLSGTVPFAFDTPVAVLLAHTRTPPPPLPADVPAPVRELVEALLAKDPESRPASAREVVRRVESVRAQLARGTAEPVASPAASGLAAEDVGGTPATSGAGATAVLPAPGAPVPLTVRPARPVRSPDRAGLAGRPGQRRAVRVTALLLGLLAVALGWRESSRGTADPAPARSPAPTSSAAPSSPAVERSGAADAPAVPAPAGAAPVAPGEQPAPVTEDVAPRQAPQQGPQQGQPQVPEQGQPQAPPPAGAGGQGQDAADEAAEKAAEKADKAGDKQDEPGHRGGANGGEGNGGGGNGGGGNGGGGNGGGGNGGGGKGGG